MLFEIGEMERTGFWDIGIEGRRFELWWSAKGDGIGCVRVMVDWVMCEMVVEVISMSDGEAAVVLVFEDVLRLICGYVIAS